MIEFNVKIAEETAKIRCRYPSNHAFFKAYLTDEPESFVIEPTEDDIRLIAANFQKMVQKRGEKSRDYGGFFYENNAIHSLLTAELLKRGVLLIHGAAIAVDGQAYLFTARSGTGKSTHTRLWRELFGSRVTMINDDKPLLRPTKNGVTVYGTPWDGGEGLNTNTQAPLKAIIKLERGEENSIRPLKTSEMIPEFFAASLRGQTSLEITHSMDLQSRILSAVKLYSMKCTPTIDAARVAAKALGISFTSFMPHF